MDVKGQDWVYIGLGLAAFYLVSQNTKPLSGVVSGASSVVTPLLSTAGKGAEILTKKETYKTYTQYLLEAPFTPSQAWDLFKQQPSLATLTNWQLTTLGVMR